MLDIKNTTDTARSTSYIEIDISITLSICMAMVIVLNATFNNISAISWWSVLLVGETVLPGENHRPAASH